MSNDGGLRRTCFDTVLLGRNLRYAWLRATDPWSVFINANDFAVVKG